MFQMTCRFLQAMYWKPRIPGQRHSQGEAGNGSFLGYTRVERNFRTCVKMRDKVTYEGVNRKATQTNL